jgi:hypothetical protein
VKHILSHQNQNKDNKIGNGNRTIEFETEQLQGVFPNVNQDDFFKLQNGNKAIQLIFDAKVRSYINKFEVLIEFLYDYPNSPPNVRVIRPDITGAPHTLFNKRMCYNNPSLDWKSSFTSYDVAIMIQSWIYAYCKWKESGKWDWYQDLEYIPSPPLIKESIRPKPKNALQTIKPKKNDKIIKQDNDYYKTPLYYYYSNQQADNERIEEEEPLVKTYGKERHPVFNPQLDSFGPNNYNNSSYGRTTTDNYVDNSESIWIVGRLIFASIFSVMFLADNHWTTMIVIAPFVALLFISKKSRTFLFIILSLFIVLGFVANNNPWSFVVIPIFGLMYTTKKRYQIPILSAIILFWIFVALYGYSIVDLQIFKLH